MASLSRPSKTQRAATFVRVQSDGRCGALRAARVSREPFAECEVPASSSAPATRLSMFARAFDVSQDAADALFRIPLPGLFGRRLVQAPIDFAWDHAATMQVADLDRMLTQLYELDLSALPRRNATPTAVDAFGDDSRAASDDEDVDESHHGSSDGEASDALSHEEPSDDAFSDSDEECEFCAE